MPNWTFRVKFRLPDGTVLYEHNIEREIASYMGATSSIAFHTGHNIQLGGGRGAVSLRRPLLWLGDGRPRAD